MNGAYIKTAHTWINKRKLRATETMAQGIHRVHIYRKVLENGKARIAILFVFFTTSEMDANQPSKIPDI